MYSSYCDRIAQECFNTKYSLLDREHKDFIDSYMDDKFHLDDEVNLYLDERAIPGYFITSTGDIRGYENFNNDYRQQVFKYYPNSNATLYDTIEVIIGSKAIIDTLGNLLWNSFHPEELGAKWKQKYPINLIWSGNLVKDDGTPTQDIPEVYNSTSGMYQNAYVENQIYDAIEYIIRGEFENASSTGLSDNLIWKLMELRG